MYLDSLVYESAYLKDGELKEPEKADEMQKFFYYVVFGDFYLQQKRFSL